MLNYVRRYTQAIGQQFSETEAWNLFRLAAFAEAIGWTLLIGGIIITDYITPGNRDAVIIAGQIHGLIFFAYIIAAAVFSTTLGWSPLKTLIGITASIPPYGSLVFEWYANHSRSLKSAEKQYYLQMYSRLLAS